MNGPIPAGGEAMPRPSDEQVAAAMRSLEPIVTDIKHMATITSALILDTFDRAEGKTPEGRLIFEFSKETRDRFLFAVCDVEKRVSQLKAAYFAAWDGEATE